MKRKKWRETAFFFIRILSVTIQSKGLCSSDTPLLQITVLAHVLVLKVHEKVEVYGYVNVRTRLRGT